MPWFRKHHCLMQRPLSHLDAEIEPDEHEAIQGAKSAKSAYAFSDRPALDPSPRFPQLLGRRPAEIAARKKAALDAGLTPAS
jgi:hypothetical protein